MVPPRLLGEADAMFTTDDPSHGEDPAKQLIENAVHAWVLSPGPGRGHQVDMNVAVPGVAKAGDGNPMFFLQPGGQAE